MKKNKKSVYYIYLRVDAIWEYDNDMKISFTNITNSNGDDTNIEFTTGFYSKKKAKKVFETICLLNTYSKAEVFIEKDTIGTDEDTRRVIGSIKLINEEKYNKKKMRKKINKLNWD